MPYEALQMKSAFYHRIFGVLSIGALPTGSPHGGERRCSISKACRDMSLGVPSPRSPYEAPPLTDAASPERAETPVKETSVSTAFFYPFLKVRGKGGPFRIPDGVLMERNACFQSLLLHIVQSPQYRSSPSRLPSQSSHRER